MKGTIMKRPTEQKQQNLTAAQRLEGLEHAARTMDQAIGQMMNQVRIMTQALKLLSERVDAIVKASSSGTQITEESLNAIRASNQASELKAKVEELKALGVLVPSDEVTEQGFIVFREVDKKTGEVASQRTQLTVSSMTPEWRALFLGKKVGDLIEKEGVDYEIHLEEVYQIAQEPAQEATQEASA
jgi:phosphomevalonate kinase